MRVVSISSLCRPLVVGLVLVGASLGCAKPAPAPAGAATPTTSRDEPRPKITVDRPSSRTLASLFEEHALLALEKQEKLVALLGEHEWVLDLDAGQVRFDDRHAFGVQILGTVSESDGSWLWAWADTHSPLPDDLLDTARQLRDLDTADRIPELQQPSVELSQIDGHYLSMIASGLTRANAYYRGPIEGGAVFFLIFAPEIDRQPGFDRKALEGVLTYLITTYEIRPRAALVAYLKAKRLRWSEDGQSLRFRLASGESVGVEFFLSGAIKSWDGESQTAVDPAKP